MITNGRSKSMASRPSLEQFRNCLTRNYWGTVAATAGGLLLAGQEFFAALAGAGILVGRAAVSITDKLVDLRDSERGPNAEVAFVHDIKRKGEKTR